MKARLIFTALVVPAILVAQYFFTPSTATLPIFLGIATGFLLWIWSSLGRKTDGDQEGVLFQYGLAGIGGAVAVVALTMVVQSILSYKQTTNWFTEQIVTENKWVADNLANGRLSFYVSAIAYGVMLLWNGYRCQIAKIAIWQYLIYGGGLLALSYGYSFAQEIVYLGLLSWSIFFIIGDWAIIEHFVVQHGARLPYPHFIRIISLNTLILFSLTVVQIQVFTSELVLYNYAVQACLIAAVVTLWIISLVKLFPMTQRDKPYATTNGIVGR